MTMFRVLSTAQGLQPMQSILLELSTTWFWVERFKTNVSNLFECVDEELPQKRKLLIFLNPFSCAGRAARVWRRARIILDKAYINQYFIETERAGHAYTFVHTEDLDE